MALLECSALGLLPTSMSFRKFPNQAPALRLLRNSLAAGRLGHAYLFGGGSLEEMEAVAATVAKVVNCEQPPERSPHGAALDCCDACSSCRRIASGNYPDLQWIRPESKLRVIRIEQTRDLIQTIQLKPVEAKVKVAVIVAADRMNTQSANAFLKTLEEPPPSSIILMLSTEPERVLETILSRCIRLHFAGEAGARLAADDLRWLGELASGAAAPNATLIGRYKLLGQLMARLTAVKESVEEEFAARSPLEKHGDVEGSLRERWEKELSAAVEGEYRRRRAEILLGLQWWLRDVWLLTLPGNQSGMLAIPELEKASAAVATRLDEVSARSNLLGLEELQGLLATNVQEALALEVGFLKLHL